MKKILTFLISSVVLFTGCKYDDDDLWNKVGELDGRVKTIEQTLSQMNNEIVSLQTFVEAVGEGDFITGIKETADGTGWTITFKSAPSITLKHGDAGSDAPYMSVLEQDGVYYWAITIDGNTDFLYADAEKSVKLPVTGEKGADGQAGQAGENGVTPVIGVDDDGYWTVDYGDGNGAQRLQSKGRDVMATDDGFNYLFVGYEENNRYYTFKLADGREISVMKYVKGIIVIEAEEEEYFQNSENRMFNVLLTDIQTISLSSKPDNWTVTLTAKPIPINPTSAELSITAPVSGPSTGYIILTALGADGSTVLAYFQVKADSYALKYLTFEDADYTGSGAGSYWSSLIDNPQYQGPLLYDGKTAGTATTLVDYKWYDEGNTYLAAKLRGNHGQYSWDGEVLWEWFTYDYSGGGEAISNYVNKAIAGAGFTQQLSIPYPGGNKGSDNFAIHFGYRDSMGETSESLSCIYFGDGVARVVDHMWVTSTCYFLNSAINGDAYTPALAENGYVDIFAIGWPTDDADQQGTLKEVSFRIANGRDGLIQDWQKWDNLHELGKVVKIEFNMDGSSDNYSGGGFARPAYFAYDDVAVRIE